ncbi:carbon-nitrogen hydrolase family protein [Mycobacterium sp. MYCO198283]|uniref:carbon-nitrogen hydrolase family protein n=1 Tax=Mycobacterium sp. MYCO198283 TaxID=2883505 RepID=UPI001E57C797|nr:carbon-nitrogen hydrolase family protein [Mycobacterium sp. MYCO198283]MCG5432294.1 carbon-nitrogen hydrolase family protein [Mycobacterium sp. MYCO198283]
MRIALAQLAAGTDPSANLELVADHTSRAAAAGADLVVFPEATMCRFGVSLGPVAEPLDGPWASGVRRIAAAAGITVVAGMFVPAPDGRVRNTLLATGNGVDTHYDKIFLFDAYGFTESRTVAPGRRPVVIEVAGVRVGLTTCYDVRFPELYRALADRGAQVITVSASWGSGPGKLAQWTVLTRARALDSSSFVAAAGQAYPGDDVAASTSAPTGVGGSLLASPYGEVVAEAGADPELVVADVDLAKVTEARDTLGVLRNRRYFAELDASPQDRPPSDDPEGTSA